MSDENTKATETPDSAASALSAGLGAALSNTELADAIEAAYQRARETGRIFSHYQLLEQHLGALLEIQRERANSRAATIQECITAIEESQNPTTTPWDCVDAIRRKFQKTPNVELTGAARHERK
jgi:lipoate-protein ligase A